MRRTFLIAALIFTAPVAQAALTITGISGVSSVTITPATTTPTTPGGPATPNPTGGTASATAYGGTAGTDCSGTAGSLNATCDSCANNTSCMTVATSVDQFPLCACNVHRIYDDLIVNIQITKSTPDAGIIRATANATTGGTSGELTIINPSPSSVSFTWRDICNHIDGSNTCVGKNTSITISVYNDKDGGGSNTGGEEKVDVTFKIVSPGSDENIFGEPYSEGVGDFTPFPGDDRIYFPDNMINAATTFPALGYYGSTISAVKILLSDKSLAEANPKEKIKPDTDLSVTAGSDTVSDDHIDDVENGKAYYVRMAMVDLAGNIVQMYPNLTGNDHAGNPHPECFAAGPLDPKACPFAVIPDQVLGLLSKDFNCFIATAAIGSSLEPRLSLFRKFRNQILLRSSWGQNFVLKYYIYGPYAARFISNKPVLRAAVRGFLWPALGFSWLTLKFGWAKGLAFSVLILMATLTLAIFGLRRLVNRV